MRLHRLDVAKRMVIDDLPIRDQLRKDEGCTGSDISPSACCYCCVGQLRRRSCSGRDEPQGGQPPPDSRSSFQEFDDQIKYQRAFEAVLWNMPAIVIYSFRRAAFDDLGVRDKDIIAYSAPATPKLEAITANSSTHLTSRHSPTCKKAAAPALRCGTLRVRKMEPLLPLKLAMALAWKEYRAAKADLMTRMSNGCAYGDSWRLKQLRLNSAIDTLGRLPRANFSEK